MLEDFRVIIFISALVWWPILYIIVLVINIILMQIFFVPAIFLEKDFGAWLAVPAVIATVIHIKIADRLSKTTINKASWEEYCEQVNSYSVYNKHLVTLENYNVKLLILDSSIKILNKKNNKILELVPKSKIEYDKINIIWDIFQMNFNKHITYDGLQRWCNKYIKDSIRMKIY